MADYINEHGEGRNMTFKRNGYATNNISIHVDKGNGFEDESGTNPNNIHTTPHVHFVDKDIVVGFGHTVKVPVSGMMLLSASINVETEVIMAMNISIKDENGVEQVDWDVEVIQIEVVAGVPVPVGTSAGGTWNYEVQEGWTVSYSGGGVGGGTMRSTIVIDPTYRVFDETGDEFLSEFEHNVLDDDSNAS